MTAPQSFVEFEQHQAEHLGRLQIGHWTAFRNVVQCHIVDESGDYIGSVTLPMRDLPDGTRQALWDLGARLAEPTARALTATASESILLLAALPVVSGDAS